MPNATDIITYIGVPLAVLGVLPILYTAFHSLLTLQNIKRKLKSNGVETLSTASSLMSGIVEVTLPRYVITPLDRDEDPGYWNANSRPSNLRGASWTLFNWNYLVTGSRLYRLQYSDDLRLPQAEISFDDLLFFLLDRGAVPDVKGLRLFRTSGLWTPVGTSLMLSPDTTKSALRVALPDDSEGVISLALSWEPAWDKFRTGGIRPGWMRINLPEKLQPEKVEESIARDEKHTEKVDEKVKEVEAEKHPEKPDLQEDPAHDAKSTSLRFSHSGSVLTISRALWEFSDDRKKEFINLEHLDKKPAVTWIPTIALALGISKSLPLYNHSLDEALRPLALQNTIPCGLLVMMDILPEADAPSWETKYDPFEDMNTHHRRFMDEQRAADAERHMAPEQAKAARSARQMASMQRHGDEFRDRIQRDRERKMKRAREAIASPRWEAGVVAQLALKWLQTKEKVSKETNLQRVVELLLIGLLQVDKRAMKVCDLLQDWQGWDKRAGMTVDDVYALIDEKEAFCYAACVMGLLKEVFTKEESAVAADMRECAQHWKQVRVG